MARSEKSGFFLLTGFRKHTLEAKLLDLIQRFTVNL